MYKVCVFDLDGTLTDTLESLTFSVNETMKEIGMPPITEEQCRMFVGNGAGVLIEKALCAGGDTGLERYEQAMGTYRRVFDQYCTYHVRPYEGIVEMLTALKERGVRLAVLTNKPDRQAVRVVSEAFPEGLFDVVQGQKEGVPRKPDPTAVLQIAESLGASPEETLYIGDSEVDAATGSAAGMHTVLVTWGFRDRDTLERLGVGVVKDSAGDITEQVLNPIQEETV